MLRITSGKFKNRKLKTPKTKTTRPTSDRFRQLVFNKLGPLVEGCSFLDCFAGSGAVGLEALSRGAGHVTFIENDRFALNAIKENIALLDVLSQTTLLRGSCDIHLKKLKTPFDIIYIDPPYLAGDDTQKVLHLIDQNQLLKRGGLCLLEESKRASIDTSFTHMTLQEKSVSGKSVLYTFKETTK